MTAAEVISFPNHLARFGVQASGSKAAKMHVNPSRLNHGRRGGIAVHRGAIADRFRVIAVKYTLVEPNLPCVRIQTDGEKVVSILPGCRQPHLIALDDRG